MGWAMRNEWPESRGGVAQLLGGGAEPCTGFQGPLGKPDLPWSWPPGRALHTHPLTYTQTHTSYTLSNTPLHAPTHVLTIPCGHTHTLTTPWSHSGQTPRQQV